MNETQSETNVGPEISDGRLVRISWGLLVLFSGPVLILAFGTSDTDVSSAAWYFRSIPFGLFAVALIGYSLAVRQPADGESVLRLLSFTLLLAAGPLAILLNAFVASSLGTGYTSFFADFHYPIVVTFPAATWLALRLLTPTPVRWYVELGASVVVFALMAIDYDRLVSGGANGWDIARLLFAVVPLAVLVVLHVRPTLTLVKAFTALLIPIGFTTLMLALSRL